MLNDGTDSANHRTVPLSVDLHARLRFRKKPRYSNLCCDIFTAAALKVQQNRFTRQLGRANTALPIVTFFV